MRKIEQEKPVNINIQNSTVIWGDVQVESLQTGDYSIHKQLVTMGKKKGILKRITEWIFKKTSHFILTVIVAISVAVIAAIVVDIFADFGWLQSIKAFIYSVLWPK